MKIVAITHNSCESNHDLQNPLQSKAQAQQQQSNLYQLKNLKNNQPAQLHRTNKNTRIGSNQLKRSKTFMGFKSQPAP
jgi:hypothetical protein